DERVQFAAEALLDFLDGAERAFGVGEVDLDVILRTHCPRTVLSEGVARARDDAPSGGGEAFHRGVADAAARSGEKQRAARLVRGGGVLHGVDRADPSAILPALYRDFRHQ